MFDRLERLGIELDHLATASAGNPDLEREVALFVTQVVNEVSLGFSDVHDVLRAVAYLPPSEVSPDRVKQLQEQLASTYARDKFKNVLGICDRLQLLAEGYRKNIEPRVSQQSSTPTPSELFYLLERHEGAFIITIQTAIGEVESILNRYSGGQDIDAARERARQGLKELEQALQAVTHAKNHVIASLPRGASYLFDPRHIADDILRRNPWFSGTFYLAVAVILLTGLTIVAGNVSAVAFPLVIVGTFAGLTIIGAFQLKNDDRLSEKGFLQLIDLAMRRVLLPLARKRRN